VADDPAAAGGDPRIRFVPDTLQALQALAREHRRALGIPILAISGSNGKTTTKELVSRVLASRFEVYATRGNLNNHIGVPLTLLAMDARTQFGIVEMGASACGEIALLASVAEPDYGLLTNVGRAHLEGFGGPEGVRRGKGELFDYLAAHGGTAFVPEEDATLSAMAAERPAMAVERYSRSLADGLENRLEGSYNRYNIAAAVAVGHRFGIPDGEIRRAIASYTPDNNRSQRTETERNTLVVDCYNAKAVEHARVGRELPRRTARPPHGPGAHPGRHARTGRVVGRRACHRRPARFAGSRRLWRRTASGRNRHATAAGRSGVRPRRGGPSPQTRRDGAVRLARGAARTARTRPVENALVLLKGSRGIGLEKALEAL